MEKNEKYFYIAKNFFIAESHKGLWWNVPQGYATFFEETCFDTPWALETNYYKVIPRLEGQKLSWEGRKNLPVPVFPTIMPLICMREKTYGNLSHFFEGRVVRINFSVEDESFVAIRPNHFLDILDEEKSTVRSRNGKLIQIKAAVFLEPPPSNSHFFGLEFSGEPTGFFFASADLAELMQTYGPGEFFLGQ